MTSLFSFASGEDTSNTEARSFPPKGMRWVLRNVVCCSRRSLVSDVWGGITKQGNELSVERRYLSCAGEFRMQLDIGFIDCYRVQSIFDRYKVVVWKWSCNLCEPEARVVFFQNGVSMRRPDAMWWCDDATGAASRTVPDGRLKWLLSVEFEGWLTTWSARLSQNSLASVPLFPSTFNAVYHVRSRRGGVINFR
jgi:hypothetical protein